MRLHHGRKIMLQGANRATLLVFVGAGTPGEMALAVILAMFPGENSLSLLDNLRRSGTLIAW